MAERRSLMIEEMKKLLTGITKDRELVFIKIEIGSCNNNHYTITHDTYSGVITEEKGIEEARERLSDSEYWKDIGMLQKSFLSDFIDFEAAADKVINTDGWQNTNGEYYEIGEYAGEKYFINFSSCGANAIGALKKEYMKLLITEEEKQILIESDKLHLKDFKEYTKEEKAFFENKILPLFNKQNQQLTDAEELIKDLKEEATK